MKHTFTMLLLFVTTITFGQVTQWIEQAKTAEGREQVDLYNKIAEHYTFDSEPFSAKTYAQKALEIANNINYSDGLAVAYFFLAESHNLNGDLKAAEKTYKKWYKTRKRHGSEAQLNWAIIGMARFYQSQEHDWKTECYYKKALKKAEKDSYREFGILNALANYYQYGKSYNSDRALNLKKTAKYLELATESGRKLYGKDFSTGTLDYYFSTELVKALDDKKQIRLANTIAEKWLISRAKFVGNEELYFTSRQIARYFFDRQIYTHIKPYLDKSIASAKKDTDTRLIKRGISNAIYMMKNAKQFDEAFRYCFSLSAYETNSRYIIQRLNGCVYPMVEEKNPTLVQTTISQISTWQKTLDKTNDKALYDWTVETLAFFKMSR